MLSWEAIGCLICLVCLHVDLRQMATGGFFYKFRKPPVLIPSHGGGKPLSCCKLFLNGGMEGCANEGSME